MRLMSSPIIRVIALVIVIVFSIEQLAIAAPQGIRAISHTASADVINSQSVFNHPMELPIPDEFAQLEEIHRGTNDKFVVYIQDPHSNYSGQKNLANTLDYYFKQNDKPLVLVEGSSEDVSLNDIRELESPKTWEIVANRFLLDGVISGEEYLNLTSNHSMRIIGIEDQDLYNSNLLAYSTITTNREQIIAYLVSIQNSIQRIKDRLYPEELRYERSIKISGPQNFFMNQFTHLFELMKSRDILLISQKFPEIQKLKDIFEREKSIDYDRVNLEQKELLMHLTSKGYKKKVQSFLKRKFSHSKNPLHQFKLLQDLAHLLESQADSKGYANSDQGNIAEALQNPNKWGRRFQHEYPNLHEYYKHLEAFMHLKYSRLFIEINDLENQIYEAYMESEDTRKVRAIDKYTHLLLKSYRIQMTSQEYKYLLDNKPDFQTVSWQAFLNQKLSELEYFDDFIPYNRLLDQANDHIEHFFAIVQERDHKFIHNIIRNMESREEKIAFVIVGGYHSQNLTQLMRDEGISYAVLSPLVEAETDHAKYEKLLLSEVPTMKIQHEIKDEFNNQVQNALRTPGGLKLLTKSYLDKAGGRLSVQTKESILNRGETYLAGDTSNLSQFSNENGGEMEHQHMGARMNTKINDPLFDSPAYLGFRRNKISGDRSIFANLPKTLTMESAIQFLMDQHTLPYEERAKIIQRYYPQIENSLRKYYFGSTAANGQYKTFKLIKEKEGYFSMVYRVWIGNGIEEKQVAINVSNNFGHRSKLVNGDFETQRFYNKEGRTLYHPKPIMRATIQHEAQIPMNLQLFAPYGESFLNHYPILTPQLIHWFKAEGKRGTKKTKKDKLFIIGFEWLPSTEIHFNGKYGTKPLLWDNVKDANGRRIRNRYIDLSDRDANELMIQTIQALTYFYLPERNNGTTLTHFFPNHGDAVKTDEGVSFITLRGIREGVSVPEFIDSLVHLYAMDSRNEINDLIDPRRGRVNANILAPLPISNPGLAFFGLERGLKKLHGDEVGEKLTRKWLLEYRKSDFAKPYRQYINQFLQKELDLENVSFDHLGFKPIDQTTYEAIKLRKKQENARLAEKKRETEHQINSQNENTLQIKSEWYLDSDLRATNELNTPGFQTLETPEATSFARLSSLEELGRYFLTWDRNDWINFGIVVQFIPMLWVAKLQGVELFKPSTYKKIAPFFQSEKHTEFALKRFFSKLNLSVSLGRSLYGAFAASIMAVSSLLIFTQTSMHAIFWPIYLASSGFIYRSTFFVQYMSNMMNLKPNTETSISDLNYKIRFLKSIRLISGVLTTFVPMVVLLNGLNIVGLYEIDLPSWMDFTSLRGRLEMVVIGSSVAFALWEAFDYINFWIFSFYRLFTSFPVELMYSFFNNKPLPKLKNLMGIGSREIWRLEEIRKRKIAALTTKAPIGARLRGTVVHTLLLLLLIFEARRTSLLNAFPTGGHSHDVFTIGKDKRLEKIKEDIKRKVLETFIQEMMEKIYGHLNSYGIKFVVSVDGGYDDIDHINRDIKASWHFLYDSYRGVSVDDEFQIELNNASIQYSSFAIFYEENHMIKTRPLTFQIIPSDNIQNGSEFSIVPSDPTKEMIEEIVRASKSSGGARLDVERIKMNRITENLYSIDSIAARLGNKILQILWLLLLIPSAHIIGLSSTFAMGGYRYNALPIGQDQHAGVSKDNMKKMMLNKFIQEMTEKIYHHFLSYNIRFTTGHVGDYSYIYHHNNNSNITWEFNYASHQGISVNDKFEIELDNASIQYSSGMVIYEENGRVIRSGHTIAGRPIQFQILFSEITPGKGKFSIVPDDFTKNLIQEIVRTSKNSGGARLGIVSLFQKILLGLIRYVSIRNVPIRWPGSDIDDERVLQVKKELGLDRLKVDDSNSNAESEFRNKVLIPIAAQDNVILYFADGNIFKHIARRFYEIREHKWKTPFLTYESIFSLLYGVVIASTYWHVTDKVEKDQTHAISISNNFSLHSLLYGLLSPVIMIILSGLFGMTLFIPILLIYAIVCVLCALIVSELDNLENTDLHEDLHAEAYLILNRMKNAGLLGNLSAPYVFDKWDAEFDFSELSVTNLLDDTTISGSGAYDPIFERRVLPLSKVKEIYEDRIIRAALSVVDSEKEKSMDPKLEVHGSGADIDSDSMTLPIDDTRLVNAARLGGQSQIFQLSSRPNGFLNKGNTTAWVMDSDGIHTYKNVSDDVDRSPDQPILRLGLVDAYDRAQRPIQTNLVGSIKSKHYRRELSGIQGQIQDLFSNEIVKLIQDRMRILFRLPIEYDVNGAMVIQNLNDRLGSVYLLKDHPNVIGYVTNDFVAINERLWNSDLALPALIYLLGLSELDEEDLEGEDGLISQIFGEHVWDSLEEAMHQLRSKHHESLDRIKSEIRSNVEQGLIRTFGQRMTPTQIVDLLSRDLASNQDYSNAFRISVMPILLGFIYTGSIEPIYAFIHEGPFSDRIKSLLRRDDRSIMLGVLGMLEDQHTQLARYAYHWVNRGRVVWVHLESPDIPGWHDAQYIYLNSNYAHPHVALRELLESRYNQQLSDSDFSYLHLSSTQSYAYINRINPDRSVMFPEIGYTHEDVTHELERAKESRRKQRALRDWLGNLRTNAYQLIIDVITTIVVATPRALVLGLIIVSVVFLMNLSFYSLTMIAAGALVTIKLWMAHGLDLLTGFILESIKVTAVLIAIPIIFFLGVVLIPFGFLEEFFGIPMPTSIGTALLLVVFIYKLIRGDYDKTLKPVFEKVAPVVFRTDNKDSERQTERSSGGIRALFNSRRLPLVIAIIATLYFFNRKNITEEDVKEARAKQEEKQNNPSEINEYQYFTEILRSVGMKNPSGALQFEAAYRDAMADINSIVQEVENDLRKARLLNDINFGLSDDSQDDDAMDLDQIQKAIQRNQETLKALHKAVEKLHECLQISIPISDIYRSLFENPETRRFVYDLLDRINSDRARGHYPGTDLTEASHLLDMLVIGYIQGPADRLLGSIKQAIDSAKTRQDELADMKEAALDARWRTFYNSNHDKSMNELLKAIEEDDELKKHLDQMMEQAQELLASHPHSSNIMSEDDIRRIIKLMRHPNGEFLSPEEISVLTDLLSRAQKIKEVERILEDWAGDFHSIEEAIRVLGLNPRSAERIINEIQENVGEFNKNDIDTHLCDVFDKAEQMNQNLKETNEQVDQVIDGWVSQFDDVDQALEALVRDPEAVEKILNDIQQIPGSDAFGAIPFNSTAGKILDKAREVRKSNRKNKKAVEGALEEWIGQFGSVETAIEAAENNPDIAENITKGTRSVMGGDFGGRTLSGDARRLFDAAQAASPGRGRPIKKHEDILEIEREIAEIMATYGSPESLAQAMEENPDLGQRVKSLLDQSLQKRTHPLIQELNEMADELREYSKETGENMMELEQLEFFTRNKRLTKEEIEELRKKIHLINKDAATQQALVKLDALMGLERGEGLESQLREAIRNLERARGNLGLLPQASIPTLPIGVGNPLPFPGLPTGMGQRDSDFEIPPDIMNYYRYYLEIVRDLFRLQGQYVGSEEAEKYAQDFITVFQTYGTLYNYPGHSEQTGFVAAANFVFELYQVIRAAHIDYQNYSEYPDVIKKSIMVHEGRHMQSPQEFYQIIRLAADYNSRRRMLLEDDERMLQDETAIGLLESIISLFIWEEYEGYLAQYNFLQQQLGLSDQDLDDYEALDSEGKNNYCLKLMSDHQIPEDKLPLIRNEVDGMVLFIKHPFEARKQYFMKFPHSNLNNYPYYYHRMLKLEEARGNIAIDPKDGGIKVIHPDKFLAFLKDRKDIPFEYTEGISLSAPPPGLLDQMINLNNNRFKGPQTRSRSVGSSAPGANPLGVGSILSGQDGERKDYDPRSLTSSRGYSQHSATDVVGDSARKRIKELYDLWLDSISHLAQVSPDSLQAERLRGAIREAEALMSGIVLNRPNQGEGMDRELLRNLDQLFEDHRDRGERFSHYCALHSVNLISRIAKSNTDDNSKYIEYALSLLNGDLYDYLPLWVNPLLRLISNSKNHGQYLHRCLVLYDHLSQESPYDEINISRKNTREAFLEELHGLLLQGIDLTEETARFLVNRVYGVDSKTIVAIILKLIRYSDQRELLLNLIIKKRQEQPFSYEEDPFLNILRSVASGGLKIEPRYVRQILDIYKNFTHNLISKGNIPGESTGGFLNLSRSESDNLFNQIGSFADIIGSLLNRVENEAMLVLLIENLLDNIKEGFVDRDLIRSIVKYDLNTLHIFTKLLFQKEYRDGHALLASALRPYLSVGVLDDVWSEVGPGYISYGDGFKELLHRCIHGNSELGFGLIINGLISNQDLASSSQAEYLRLIGDAIHSNLDEAAVLRLILFYSMADRENLFLAVNFLLNIALRTSNYPESVREKALEIVDGLLRSAKINESDGQRTRGIIEEQKRKVFEKLKSAMTAPENAPIIIGLLGSLGTEEAQALLIQIWNSLPEPDTETLVSIVSTGNAPPEMVDPIVNLLLEGELPSGSSGLYRVSRTLERMAKDSEEVRTKLNDVLLDYRNNPEAYPSERLAPMASALLRSGDEGVATSGVAHEILYNPTYEGADMEIAVVDGVSTFSDDYERGSILNTILYSGTSADPESKRFSDKAKIRAIRAILSWKDRPTWFYDAVVTLIVDPQTSSEVKAAAVSALHSLIFSDFDTGTFAPIDIEFVFEILFDLSQDSNLSTSLRADALELLALMNRSYYQLGKRLQFDQKLKDLFDNSNLRVSNKAWILYRNIYGVEATAEEALNNLNDALRIDDPLLRTTALNRAVNVVTQIAGPGAEMKIKSHVNQMVREKTLPPAILEITSVLMKDADLESFVLGVAKGTGKGQKIKLDFISSHLHSNMIDIVTKINFSKINPRLQKALVINLAQQVKLLLERSQKNKALNFIAEQIRLNPSLAQDSQVGRALKGVGTIVRNTLESMNRRKELAKKARLFRLLQTIKPSRAREYIERNSSDIPEFERRGINMDEYKNEDLEFNPQDNKDPNGFDGSGIPTNVNPNIERGDINTNQILNEKAAARLVNRKIGDRSKSLFLKDGQSFPRWISDAIPVRANFNDPQTKLIFNRLLTHRDSSGTLNQFAMTVPKANEWAVLASVGHRNQMDTQIQGENQVEVDLDLELGLSFAHSNNPSLIETSITLSTSPSIQSNSVFAIRNQMSRAFELGMNLLQRIKNMQSAVVFLDLELYFPQFVDLKNKEQVDSLIKLSRSLLSAKTHAQKKGISIVYVLPEKMIDVRSELLEDENQRLNPIGQIFSEVVTNIFEYSLLKNQKPIWITVQDQEHFFKDKTSNELKPKLGVLRNSNRGLVNLSYVLGHRTEDWQSITEAEILFDVITASGISMASEIIPQRLINLMKFRTNSTQILPGDLIGLKHGLLGEELRKGKGSFYSTRATNLVLIRLGGIIDEAFSHELVQKYVDTST